jgi:hypothetical protein
VTSIRWVRVRAKDDYTLCIYVLMWCYRGLLSCDRLTVFRAIFVMWVVCVLCVLGVCGVFVVCGMWCVVCGMWCLVCGVCAVCRV